VDKFAMDAFADTALSELIPAGSRILAAGLGPLAGLIGAADLAARAEEQR